MTKFRVPRTELGTEISMYVSSSLHHLDAWPRLHAYETIGNGGEAQSWLSPLRLRAAVQH